MEKRDQQRRDYTETIAFLQSEAGTTIYSAKVLEPAFFAPSDISIEIARLSRVYHQTANVISMPYRPGLPNGVIASWGDVALVPLDLDSVYLLAGGANPKMGFIVDFLGDFKRSAQEGLPIYVLKGSAGMIYQASLDDNGKGMLRISAIDASKLTLINPPQTELPQPAPLPNPELPPPQPQLSKTAALRDALSNFNIDNLPQDLKDEYKSLIAALDEKRAPRSLTEGAITDLSSRTQTLVEKVHEFEGKSNIVDDIKKIREVIESKRGSLKDEGLQGTINEQLAISAPASTEMSISELKKVRSNLQDVAESVAQYYELTMLRDASRERIDKIKETLAGVIGDVPQLDVLRGAIETLEKNLDRETINSLRAKLNELNELYEAHKDDIAEHTFQQF